MPDISVRQRASSLSWQELYAVHGRTSLCWVCGPGRAHTVKMCLSKYVKAWHSDERQIYINSLYAHCVCIYTHIYIYTKCINTNGKLRRRTKPSFVVWQNLFLVMRFPARGHTSILFKRRKSRAHLNFCSRAAAGACVDCARRL